MPGSRPRRCAGLLWSRPFLGDKNKNVIPNEFGLLATATALARCEAGPFSAMMSRVLKKMLYLVGRMMAGLIWLATLVVLVVAGTPAGPWQPPVVFLLSAAGGVVAHELGHLLACLATGARVKAFRLGSERAAIRFRVRSVVVSLGWPYRGRVEYTGATSVGRRAMITLAGSLTQLVVAGVVLAFSAGGMRPLVVTAALGLGVTGLIDLMPLRLRSGRLSDGARLFKLRSDVRAATTIEAQKTAGRLLRAGLAAELLELHKGLDVPARRMSVAQARALAMVECSVALLAGLPQPDALLAERRASFLLHDHHDGFARSVAGLTLAFLRLRAGGAGTQAEVERLCDQALAAKELPDPMRCLALAAVILSRQARGLPDADVRATAAGLKAAERGIEPFAAGLSAVVDPEGFLSAFRAGAPDTRLGAGSLAPMLRRQGRVGELLELHNGYEMPAGRYASAQARSLHEVEYNVLLVPGLPPAVTDEAASRVEWILGDYPFASEGASMPRPAVEHTLALARLRQGRFEEVAQLCAGGLADDHGPDARATILATVALARRALGQPHADLVAEAVSLSAHADLVAEAAEDSRLAGVG